MLILCSFLLTIIHQCVVYSFNSGDKPPTIFVAVLARNKEITLPYFLSLLQEQDYPKDRISLWITSDHNQDNTVLILNEWVSSVSGLYHSLVADIQDSGNGFPDETGPAHWSISRFNHVINLREKALNTARKNWADFILFLDCDVFLTNKQTFRYLVKQNYTVTAPMLKSNGMYSNFWCGMTKDYYYLRTDDYKPILKGERRGCFHVPMIHSAVLVNLRRLESDKLSFVTSNIKEYKGPTDDIIAFALSANKSDIPLYVCNEELFGYLMVPLEQNDPLQNDRYQLTNLKLEVLVDNPPLFVNNLLSHFVPPVALDRMGMDVIYMINLRRRPERRKRMMECFKQLGLDVTVYDAIDGRSLNETVLSDMGIHFMPEYKDPYHKRAMTHGEIGCFLSHYKIWEEIVKNEDGLVMVLEDDVRFEPYFRQKVINLIREANGLKLEWDLIYLGRKRLQDDEEWVKGSKSLVHVSYSYWTLGYLLTLKGARKLLEQNPLENLIPVDEYIPILFDKHPEETWKKHFPKRDLVAYSVAPLLLYPTHYTGETGYISDTENSQIIPESLLPKDEL